MITGALAAQASPHISTFASRVGFNWFLAVASKRFFKLTLILSLKTPAPRKPAAIRLESAASTAAGISATAIVATIPTEPMALIELANKGWDSLARFG